MIAECPPNDEYFVELEAVYADAEEFKVDGAVAVFTVPHRFNEQLVFSVWLSETSPVLIKPLIEIHALPDVTGLHFIAL